MQSMNTHFPRIEVVCEVLCLRILGKTSYGSMKRSLTKCETDIPFNQQIFLNILHDMTLIVLIEDDESMS